MQLKATKYIVDAANGVATIVLSRPERHNAWTGRMHTEYRWLLDQAEADGDVRAIVVTGDPDGEAFCVGGDSEALAGHAVRGGYDAGTPDPLAQPGFGVRPEFDSTFAHQFGMTKPIIAAANGSAAGVGLAVVCYADIRFVATQSSYSAAHGPIGLAPEYGLAWLLPRLIGLAKATDLLLSSRKFSGLEAAEIGLATKSLPAAEVLNHAHEYAADLVRGSSQASLRETKRLIYTDQHRSAAAAVAESEALLNTLMADPDYEEGIRALVEKRRPRFGR